MCTHLEVFRPIWWIVWIQSTNLIDLGLLRYSNNRLCGAQASNPRSYLLLWSQQWIVVELGKILLSTCTVWLSVQRDDGKCSSLKRTRNHFLLHHHPAMSLEVVVKTRLILLERFPCAFPRSGLSRIKVDVFRTWSDLLRIVWLFHLRSGV